MDTPGQDHPFHVDADGFDARRILVPLFCAVVILLGALTAVLPMLANHRGPRTALLPVLIVGLALFLARRKVRALERAGRWPAARERMRKVYAGSPVWMFYPLFMLQIEWLGVWLGLGMIAAAIFVLCLPRVEAARPATPAHGA